MTRIQNRTELLSGCKDPAQRARRALALDLFDAALLSIDPVVCTQKALRELEDAGELSQPVTLFAFGKAARGMAEAALAEVEVTRGIVIGFESGQLGPLTLLRGGHPVACDDAASHGKAMLALAESLTANDVALVLVSGGGSAMLELPAFGLTLQDLQHTTRVLLASGANIREVNAVRSALSAVKGGRLARAMAPARVVNVVLSDVIGSPLPSIASGPTVAPDLQGPHVVDILARYALHARLSPAVLKVLGQGTATAAAFDHVMSVIAADNLTAQEAAVDAARRLGHRARRRDAYLEGEARLMGPTLLSEARGQSAIYVAGGETTVTLGAQVGCGGRNQELVLSAAPQLGDVLIASVGTDGIDGASEAAGALCDSAIVQRSAALGLDLSAALANHDAGSLLASSGGTIRTGPTGTNVADLCLVVP